MLDETDLSKIKGLLTSELQRELKPVKRDILKIKKNVNMLIGYFDEKNTKFQRRVTRIETHLGLPVS